jgi:hypothetical protein
LVLFSKILHNPCAKLDAFSMDGLSLNRISPLFI